MKKYFLLVLIVCSLLLSACKENSFEEILFHTMEDPFEDVLQCNSLRLENTIYLNWKEDIACDEFRIMKSTDSTVPDFKCIYSGCETSFVDTNIESGCRYLYKIDKKRGNKLFPGKVYSYAFGSDVRQDICEPNDSEGCPTQLEYDLFCNLPCVQYEYEGRLYKDSDWFYVEVPPFRKAEVIINQLKGLDNTSNGTATKLRFMIPGEQEHTVKQNIAEQLINSTNETKKIKFRIEADTTSLFSSNNACAVLEYTISLNQIIKY